MYFLCKEAILTPARHEALLHCHHRVLKRQDYKALQPPIGVKTIFHRLAAHLGTRNWHLAGLSEVHYFADLTQSLTAFQQTTDTFVTDNHANGHLPTLE